MWLLAAGWPIAACGGSPTDDIDTADAGAQSDAPAAVTPDGSRDSSAPAIDSGPSPTDSATPTDATAANDAGIDSASDAISESCATPACGPLVLLERPGCFEITFPGEEELHDFGEVGTRYSKIHVDFDIDAGPWRSDLFSRGVLNHILFGLSRNAPVSRQRYILGLAPQIDGSVTGLRRRTIFFGRNDLDARPPGCGFKAYTSFRADFPWQPGEVYHAHVELDALGKEQRLDISRAGSSLQMLNGAIDYFDLSLTDSGWQLQLGAEETAFRDISPVGWKICDVRVTAVVDRP